MQPDLSSKTQTGRVSIFLNTLHEMPANTGIASRIVHTVRSSEEIKVATEHYRSTKEPAEAKKTANNAFLCVTWCGVFYPTCLPDHLQQPSGLIALHFCDLSSKRLSWLKGELQQDEYVHILFVDEKGTGLVVVVRVGIRSIEDHLAYTRQLSDYFRDNYKVTTEDAANGKAELNSCSLAINWLCRLPHDPDVYHRPDASEMVLITRYRLDQINIDSDENQPTATPSKAKLTAFSNLLNELRTEQQKAKEQHYEQSDESTGEQQTDEPKDGQQSEWPEPKPLASLLLPVLSVEPGMIPESLRDWLLDIAHRMKCPLDFVASTCMVMLSSLIGTRLAIKPKSKDDWTVVVNMWGAAVGDPSVKKTPAMMEVLKPLKRLEAEAKKLFEQEDHRYQAEHVTYEAQKRVYQSQEQDRLKNKDVANPVDFPEPSHKPTERRYMTNDATVEKVADLLNENPTGLLQFRDELIGLLASWERAGHEMDRAFYLEAWNGNDSKTVDRIGRGTTHVGNVCISLTGGIQPAKLLGYLRAATGYENDGFVQRLQLAVYPDKPTWELIDEYPDKYARDKAFKVIQQIANSDFTGIKYETDEYDKFPYIRFSADAQTVFYEFLTDLETRIVPTESGLLQEHFAKYGSLMPSLALIFHVVNCLSSEETARPNTSRPVSLEAAKMAVQWCTYLQSHARRIYALLDTASIEGARVLIQRIKQNKLTNGFKARDVVRMGWTYLSTTQDVESALLELIERGYLRELTPAPSSGGRPEASGYLIHPKFLPNV